MLDLPIQMFYKAIFLIRGNSRTKSLYEDAIDFVFDYVTTKIGIPIAYDQFVTHSFYELPDHSVKARGISHREQGSSLWALKLRLNDPEITRRTWYIHIGIQQEKSDGSMLRLCYAQYYSDYVAGCMHMLTKPVPQTPDFVVQVVHEEAFDCTVTESFKLPSISVPLNETTLHSFPDLLFDSARIIPIVVITCPDLLDPMRVASFTLGNTIVFETPDPFVVERINSALPNSLHLSFDSFQVYPPARDTLIQPRAYPSDTIQRYGERVILALRQSFCEGTNAQERRQFITYDDIVRIRNPDRVTEEENKNKRLQKDLAQGEAERKALRSELASITERLEWTESLLGKDLLGKVTELEHVLLDSMNRDEAVKQQLRQIAAALFKNEMPDIAELPVSKEIALILEAIGYLFDRRMYTKR